MSKTVKVSFAYSYINLADDVTGQFMAAFNTGRKLSLAEETFFEQFFTSIKFDDKYVYPRKYNEEPIRVAVTAADFLRLPGNQTNDLRKEILANHLKEYRNIVITDQTQLNNLLDPRSTFLGWENRAIASAVPIQELGIIRKEPQQIEKWKRLAIALSSNVKGDTIIRDITGQNVKSLDHIHTLRIKNGHYAELAQQLTVSAFRKLNYELDPHSSNQMIDFTFAKYTSNVSNGLAEMTEILGYVSTNGNPELTLDAAQKVFRIVRACRERPSLMNSVIEYFKTSPKKWTSEDLKEVEKSLFEPIWAGSNNPHYLLATLLANMEYFEEYLTWYSNMCKDNVKDYKVSKTAWAKYVKNYHDYKNYPIEWWAPLVVNA